jgi:hypothetical protein
MLARGSRASVALRWTSRRVDWQGRFSFQMALPECRFSFRSVLLTRPVSAQTGSDYPSFAEMMIKYHQAGIESNVALRQLQIGQCGSTYFWLNKILQVVSPKAKAPAEWKWKIHLVEQFESVQKLFQNDPRISE